MSSAFYPQGMKSYNNHVPQGGYKTWKGAGVFSNPVGIAPGHIRPLTNKDPGNVFPTGFGLPRPIKHYRRGRSIKHGAVADLVDSGYTKAETDQIDYNAHRYVKSSKGQSLGGGSGGAGMIQSLMDAPGEFLVKDNTVLYPDGPYDTDEMILNDSTLQKVCMDCEGVGVISSWYPIRNLTDKPEPVTTNPVLCCNEEYKARRRALPTSTNVKKNYYQTSSMYLYNRCQTFKQREFNFITGEQIDEELGLNPNLGTLSGFKAKPGSAAAMGNLYVANCNPNGIVSYGAEHAMLLDFAKYILNPAEFAVFVEQESNRIATIAEFVLYLQTTLSHARYLEAVAYMDTILFNPYTNPTNIGIASGKHGCKRVYYKPNNPTFAKEGAVSSATRTFKLNVDAIEKNAASLKGKNRTDSLVLNNPPNTSYIYKMKTPKCTPSTFTGRFQNPRICNVYTNDVSN